MAEVKDDSGVRGSKHELLLNGCGSGEVRRRDYLVQLQT